MDEGLHKLAAHLGERLGTKLLASQVTLGELTIEVSRDDIPEVIQFLRDDSLCRFGCVIDICGVDYPERGGSATRTDPLDRRFEVVLHLYSTSKRHRLRLKSRVGDAEGDGAEIDSVTEIWPGANWFEREVWDMFGIRFRGHPDLRRLLMYDEFEGHPLRQDYPVRKRQPLVGPRK